MAAPSPSPQPPPAALQPASDDGVGVATVGTVLFLAALIVCLIQRSALVAGGHEWWIWTCLTGVLVGLAFRTFASRRARAYREHAAEPVARTDPGGVDRS